MMVAEQMRKLFAYNTWAWDRVFASVARLDEANYYAPQPLFYPTIHDVLVHCMSAEYIWHARIRGISPGAMLDAAAYEDFAAVRGRWSQITHKWSNLVQGLNDAECGRVIDYRNTQGHSFSLTLADIIQHVVNHATEHRSQITPILAHLDVPTRPLDYALFRTRR